MKNLLKSLFVLLLCFIAIPVVSAGSNEIYYINNNNVRMTEEQYNYLKTELNNSDSEIRSLDQDRFDLRMSDNLEINQEIKYIKTETIYNYKGTLISSINTEVTKDEYDNSDNKVLSFTTYAGDVYSTSYKSVYISSYFKDGNFEVYLRNDWKQDPKVRSYDVMGIRWDAGISLNISTAKGEQLASGNKTNYDYMGKNMKIASNGVGISMNLYDNGSKHETAMWILGTTTNVCPKFYGTYQHATSTTTLAESKNYTFNASGKGGVLKFGTTAISNKYDGMPGVYI